MKSGVLFLPRLSITSIDSLIACTFVSKRSFESVFSHLLKTRTLNSKTTFYINSRHFSTPPLVSHEMTSEKQAQKFHTDDASPPRSG